MSSKACFIVSKLISEEAVAKLSKLGQVLLFETSELTYSSIANHPDIFICNAHGLIIIAANTPQSFIDMLIENKITFTIGSSYIGLKHPFTVFYNAVVTDHYLIHHTKHTDPFILKHTQHLKTIHVEQGYTRCNLLPLKNNHFITSDTGIFKTLSDNNLPVLKIHDDDIDLPGYPHGFFGGCCGIYKNSVLINGSLNLFKDGEIVRQFLHHLNYDIVELTNSPLQDCGSILYVESDI